MTTTTVWSHVVGHRSVVRVFYILATTRALTVVMLLVVLNKCHNLVAVETATMVMQGFWHFW
jgi:hypothetical protein